jgi:phosphatidylinositol glycan class A protein
MTNKFKICLVSDFFYPNMGGVESHLYQLAQCLLEKGHKVIIVTHAYGNRTGVRFMANMLKVYYLPIVPFYNKAILPTIVGSLPYLRYIFQLEQIQIVHGHSAFSTLSHEALFVGSILSLGTVFTDHSLFGFADASAIVTNTILKYSLANIDHCICVSHTGKENTVLRSGVPKSKVSVIPNAVDCDMFNPSYYLTLKSPKDKVVVVLGSRLVYRKGIDLVAAILPRLAEYDFDGITVDFVIGGDGPKRIILEETIERHGLQSRVTMLGEMCHSDVRDELLIKGDIFLNTSLTEAFCMAILEAVACGLIVVSTKEVNSIEAGLVKAVKEVIAGRQPSKAECHQFVKNTYDWRNVAERTEIVYQALMSDERKKLQTKVRNLWEFGTVAGPFMAVLFLFCHYWILILDFLNM